MLDIGTFLALVLGVPFILGMLVIMLKEKYFS